MYIYYLLYIFYFPEIVLYERGGIIPLPPSPNRSLCSALMYHVSERGTYPRDTWSRGYLEGGGIDKGEGECGREGEIREEMTCVWGAWSDRGRRDMERDRWDVIKGTVLQDLYFGFFRQTDSSGPSGDVLGQFHIWLIFLGVIQIWNQIWSWSKILVL